MTTAEIDTALVGVWQAHLTFTKGHAAASKNDSAGPSSLRG